ncbi:Sortilin- receptor, partial [Homalodisca vitripennis]
GYFLCSNPHACIPASWRCDGEKDCGDNSDEIGCDSNSCESWQFQCDNHHCIFKTWQCDGDYDCGDNDTSDERNCPTTVRPPTIPPRPQLPTNTCVDWMFRCNNKKCIPYWWKCDSVNDCGDNSDEIGCEPITVPTSYVTPAPPSQSGVCQSHQFRCLNGDCIQDSWVCDNIKDCEQGEDEEHCQGTVLCDSKTQFRCRQDGSCIPLRQVCDGKYQCPDYSDEMSCSHSNVPIVIYWMVVGYIQGNDCTENRAATKNENLEKCGLCTNLYNVHGIFITDGSILRLYTTVLTPTSYFD